MRSQRVVYLHVGGHKTGTTFLQNVLWHNRKELKQDGFLYPGTRRASHVWACHDLRGTGFKSYRAPQVTGAWNSFVDEIRAWNGPAIIDQEMFSLASKKNIARAMTDLSFAEVHIVFTARDLARQLPAVWQEWIKNRGTLSFAEFLAAVSEESAEAQRLRALHDVPAILAKWSEGLPPKSVHLITVPPPGTDPAVLWQRFAHVLRLDPDRYTTDIPEANTSLGPAEATVVRRLNALLSGVDQPRYDRLVKFRLAPELAQRRGVKIDLPEDAFAWAVEASKAAVQLLATADYDVVGDLDELIPAIRPAGADPDHAPADQQAEAAIAGIAALVTMPGPPENADLERELGRLRERLTRAESELAEHAGLSPRERIKRTLVELSGQVGWLAVLHRGYRRLRRR